MATLNNQRVIWLHHFCRWPNWWYEGYFMGTNSTTCGLLMSTVSGQFGCLWALGKVEASGGILAGKATAKSDTHRYNKIDPAEIDQDFLEALPNNKTPRWNLQFSIVTRRRAPNSAGERRCWNASNHASAASQLAWHSEFQGPCHTLPPKLGTSLPTSQMK